MVIRVEIIQFASEMESQLKANDKEKGDSWKEMHNRELLKLLNDSHKRLVMANTKKQGRKHAVNVANYSMMVWQNNREKE